MLIANTMYTVFLLFFIVVVFFGRCIEDIVMLSDFCTCTLRYMLQEDSFNYL